MTIDDDAPARPVIEHAVENKQDFVFIVVASPRMNAGNPVPAGSIQIIVSPKLKVGSRSRADARGWDAARGDHLAASREARGVRLTLRRGPRRRLQRGRVRRDVALTARTFVADFGSQRERSRPSTCTNQVAQQVCGTSPSVNVDTSPSTGVPSDVDGRCSAATRARTSASPQASAHLSQPVDVLQDDAFVTRVERHALSFVQLVDVAYTIPASTLTFDIPQIRHLRRTGRLDARDRSWRGDRRQHPAGSGRRRRQRRATHHHQRRDAGAPAHRTRDREQAGVRVRGRRQPAPGSGRAHPGRQPSRSTSRRS